MSKNEKPTPFERYKNLTDTEKYDLYTDEYTNARTDPLTELGNRRALYEDMENRAVTNPEEPLIFIMLDMDDFKKINDDNGHAVGDAVLKKIGEILPSLTRGLDRWYRMGGEEFFAVIQNTETADGDRALMENAVNVANRFHKRIRDYPWREKGLPKSTASLGVTVASYGDLLDDVIDQADRALYRAKEAGKDGVGESTSMVQILKPITPMD